MKMRKMEQEMEEVFEMKVQEKLQKLKDIEADVRRIGRGGGNLWPLQERCTSCVCVGGVCVFMCVWYFRLSLVSAHTCSYLHCRLQ